MHDEIKDPEVIEALEAILADDKFAAAPQMSAFLNYVVRQTLAGEAERIKAYTVAVDALGKPATFDPQNDPSVRVLAKRLRSSMDQYYERTRDHQVLIILQRGSYKPAFARPSDQVESDAGSATHQTQARSTVDVPGPVTARAASATTLADLARNTGDDRAATAGSELAGTSQCPTSMPQAAPEARINPGSKHGQPVSVTTGQTKSMAGRIAQVLPAALGRIPRPVLAMVAVTSLGWALTNHTNPASPELAQSVTDSVDLDNLEIRLASNRNELSLRARPNLPTLIIRQGLGANVPAMNINSAMVGVLSRFDTVQVLRGDRVDSHTAVWPEDYMLDLTGLRVDNTHRLTAQLSHAPSGHITWTDTLDIPLEGPLDVPLNGDMGLSDTNLEVLEYFAARLVQQHGPLFHDYRSRGDFTPSSSCLYASVDPGGSERDPADLADCAERLGSDAPTDFRTLALQAELRMQEAMRAPEALRDEELQQATALAASAVNIAPFSASAHLSLMRGYYYTGALEKAHHEAEQALALNPFDGQVLRTAAAIMSAMDEQDRADELFDRAARIDPQGASISVSANGTAASDEPLLGAASIEK